MFNTDRIDTDSYSNGTVRFQYEKENVTRQVDGQDLNMIKSFFNDKKLYKDNPSCGFTENVSIQFNKQIYCFACDGCPIIYWKNENKYFSLSSEELNKLHIILNKYGFRFPCI